MKTKIKQAIKSFMLVFLMAGSIAGCKKSSDDAAKSIDIGAYYITFKARPLPGSPLVTQAIVFTSGSEGVIVSSDKATNITYTKDDNSIVLADKGNGQKAGSITINNEKIESLTIGSTSYKGAQLIKTPDASVFKDYYKGKLRFFQSSGDVEGDYKSADGILFENGKFALVIGYTPVSMKRTPYTQLNNGVAYVGTEYEFFAFISTGEQFFLSVFNPGEKDIIWGDGLLYEK